MRRGKDKGESVLWRAGERLGQSGEFRSCVADDLVSAGGPDERLGVSSSVSSDEAER